MKNDSNSTPTDGRKSTDDSLKFERDKTDTSLADARKKTELHIDEGLSDSRSTKDEALKQHRVTVDAETSSVRHAKGYDLKAEQEAADRRLERERASSDDAIESERATGDVATSRERDIKNVIESKLLAAERGTTDQNLSAERGFVDAAALLASDSLGAEKEKHSRTQVSLTTRDEFMAIVSHDLKNPLGASLSCATMLLEDYEFTPEIRKWIELIKRNSEISMRIINDLLDVERIAENKMEITIAPHPIAKILADAAETFAIAFENKNIKFKLLNCADDIVVRCDPDRITQVIFNLLNNAIKFTPSHGDITLRVKVEKSRVAISVTDSGCGMEPEAISRIFDRFAQLKSKDRSGLGLGLYIAKNILASHSSRLSVESIPLEGSTFIFFLDRA